MSPRRAATAPECIEAVADRFGIPIGAVLDMPLGYFERLHEGIHPGCREVVRP